MKTFIVLLACAAFAADGRAADPGVPAERRPRTAPVTEVVLKGVLEQRVAIGGETTGWALRHGEAQRIELDLSRSGSRGLRAGTAVVVTGTIVMRTWPERGVVQVLVVRRLEILVPPRPPSGPREMKSPWKVFSL